jgi:hypothetical protein
MLMAHLSRCDDLPTVMLVPAKQLAIATCGGGEKYCR